MPWQACSCTATPYLSGHRLAICIARFIGLAAALVGKKCHQPLHSIKTRAVEQKSTFASHRDELRVLQFFQVKRERRGGDVQFLGKIPRCVPIRAPLDEQPKHSEARFLRKRGEGFYDIYRFHCSIFMEIPT
jgi:hypothetical protein